LRISEEIEKLEFDVILDHGHHVQHLSFGVVVNISRFAVIAVCETRIFCA
jgi:hypothetical protein